MHGKKQQNIALPVGDSADVLLELEHLKKEELLDEKDQTFDIVEDSYETIAVQTLIEDEHSESFDLKASSIDLNGRNTSSKNGKRYNGCTLHSFVDPVFSSSAKSFRKELWIQLVRFGSIFHYCCSESLLL